MYGKLFEQIYDSSVADDWKVLVTWQQLIGLADRHGVVDMTPEAIARRTNIPREIIDHGLAKLAEPDPRSRSPEAEGRRIVLLDEHRDWGWKLVNYDYYRNLASLEEKRTADRERISARRAAERGESRPVAGSRALSRKSPMQKHRQKHEILGAQSAPKVPKARNPGWEALLQACGIPLNRELPPSARGAYNRALADIRIAEGQISERELVHEIWRTAAAYRKRWPGVSLTPTALARRWYEAAAEPPGAKPAPTETFQEQQARDERERRERVASLAKLYELDHAEGETEEAFEARVRAAVAKAAEEARASIRKRRRVSDA